MKLFVKFGLVVLATWAFLAIGLPVKAGQPDWIRTKRVKFFNPLGMLSLWSHSHLGNQIPAAKVEPEMAVQANQLDKTDERWLNIYKSLSFLGGAWRAARSRRSDVCIFTGQVDDDTSLKSVETMSK